MIRASAPGSIMILGEHAVLEGRHALAAAVSRRVSVEITKRDADEIVITSALGNLRTPRRELHIQAPFEFVTSALLHWKEHLNGGVHLAITSESISAVHGLGSSAAVTVATHAACAVLLQKRLSQEELLQCALESIVRVQGSGSGTDAAASVYGGIIRYRKEPLLIESTATDLPLFLAYSGYKRKTSEVIEIVRARFRAIPEIREHLFDAIDATVLRAWAALESGDLETFCYLLSMSQGFMESLGVSDSTLRTILVALAKSPGVRASKISGSGLGDCVLGIGTAPSRFPFEIIPISVDSMGVYVDT